MIKIVTDSSCEISKELQKEYDITVVPLSIIFEDGEYLDGVTISKEEFFAKQKTSKILPKTSQVNETTFAEAFTPYLNTQDDVIAILISSGISGTYNSAVAAKKSLKMKNLDVIDSANATITLGAIVLEAAKEIKSGASKAHVLARINKLIEKAKFFTIVDDLKYLKAGGRLSSNAMIIGTILHIKPIVTMIEGKVASAYKAIGNSKAVSYLKDRLAERDEKMPVYFGHSNCRDKLNKVIDSLKMTISENNIFSLGATIGVHGGEGCVGIVYFVK